MPQPSFILVVDDDEAVRRVVRAILERQHFSVLDAGTAEAAFKIYEMHEGEIDLVISDVRMTGEDGNECVRRMRDLRPSQRVLFITAFPGEVDQSVCRFEFLPKPFSGKQLLQRVAAQLVRRAIA